MIPFILAVLVHVTLQPEPARNPPAIVCEKNDAGVVQCDAEGYEPRDAGEGSDVTLLRAREITIREDVPAALTIEWREDPSPTVLLATRKFDAAKEVRVRVAGDRDRLLRIRREGASPVTLLIARGDDSARLPQAAPGGEIYIAPRRDAFFPVAIAAGSKTYDIDRGRFFVRSLMPETVTITPLFRGGIRGRATTAKVVAGETTEVAPFPVERVGGVTARINASLCAYERPAGIVVSGADSKQIATTPLAGIDGCEAVYHGLRPGSYRVELRAQNTVLGRTQEFRVDENALASVYVEPYSVHVTGKVTKGKEMPAADLDLIFTKANRDSEAARVRTDSLGEFALDLPDPGQYAISVRQSEFIAHPAMRREFERGDQHVDIDLPPTSLAVRVRRGDGAPLGEAVQLTIGGAVSIAGPVFGDLKLEALPYGDYVARAFAGDLIADPVTVSISELSPHADVELLLQKTGGELLLVTADGTPVSGAQVMAGGRGPDEIAPGSGRYSLAGVSAGSMIRATAKSFMPVCATKRSANDSLRLVMPPRGAMAASIVVRNAKHGDFAYSISQSGSGCWARIDEFETAWTREESTLRIDVRGLPPGQYDFVALATHGRRNVTFTVPGPEVVIDAP